MNVIHYFRRTPWYQPLAALVGFSVICIAMLVFRVCLTSRIQYSFLGWNLFLAWVPLGVAMLLTFQREKHGHRFKGWQLGIGLLAWLLFLPNAPYIITDLLHLRKFVNMPIWFDSLMIFSFAMVGLQTGLFSIFLVHRLVNQQWGKPIGWATLLFTLPLTGFGVYLGRFKRWNSWDILTNPTHLLLDSLHQLTNPTAIKVTVGFAFILAVFYLLFISFTQIKEHGFTEGRNV